MNEVSSCGDYTSDVYDQSIHHTHIYTQPAIGDQPHLSDNPDMKEVARIRKSLKMSQEQLAEACGVKQATISRVERGLNKPSMELLECIAEHLGVTVVELIGLPEMERMALQRYREASPQRRAALIAILDSD